MAVSNNLGMYLPTRDDYISVKRDISDNLELVDAAAGNMDIIVNGNTASVNVTTGQFVTVLNSTITGVTDGIYKAVANVAAGVPFVAANLTSPTSGALNELVGQINNKSSIKKTSGSESYSASAESSATVTVNIPDQTGYTLIGVTYTLSGAASTGSGTIFCNDYTNLKKVNVRNDNASARTWTIGWVAVWLKN